MTALELRSENNALAGRPILMARRSSSDLRQEIRSTSACAINRKSAGEEQDAARPRPDTVQSARPAAAAQPPPEPTAHRDA